MVIWECFLQNSRSELEPEVLELEDSTVQPYSIGRFLGIVFAKVWRDCYLVAPTDPPSRSLQKAFSLTCQYE